MDISEVSVGMKVYIPKECPYTAEGPMLVREMRKYLNTIQRITSIVNHETSRVKLACGYIWDCRDFRPENSSESLEKTVEQSIKKPSGDVFFDVKQLF